MKVSDLVRFDYTRGCFVAKDNKPVRALDPWDELRLVNRPSIFLKDSYFRVKGNGTLQNKEGLGYKQFGTYTRAGERIPNKYERLPEDATPKTPRTTNRKTNKNV
jgi:hypothetical protein